MYDYANILIVCCKNTVFNMLMMSDPCSISRGARHLPVCVKINTPIA